MRTGADVPPRPNAGSPRFRCAPFVRDVAIDPGRASAPRVAVPHILPSTMCTASAPTLSPISWLIPTPHTIAVYARKKLPRTDHATSSRPCHRYGLGSEGFDLHGVAKVSEAFDQTSFFLVIGAVVKVFATEVVIHRPILKHVVDGREDGGGDGHDSLLRTAAGFDSVKLRLQVAVLLILCCPGALHQRGFEPGSPLAQAVGSALAGTLIASRTYSSP